MMNDDIIKIQYYCFIVQLWIKLIEVIGIGFITGWDFWKTITGYNKTDFIRSTGYNKTRPIQFWSFGFLIGSWVDKHWLMESCNPISDPIFANKKKVVFFWSLFLRVFKRSKFSITLFIWHFKAGYFFKVLLLQRKNICNIGPIKNHNQMYSILMLITCCDQKSERSEMNRPNGTKWSAFYN